MATRIVELFGYDPLCQTAAAKEARAEHFCHFIKAPCQKLLSDSARSGVCSLSSLKHGSVICCPHKLYAEQRKIFHDVADVAFGPHQRLAFIEAESSDHQSGDVVLIKEIPIPGRRASSYTFVDWVLAKMNDAGEILSFVPLELQTIDTTGNYRAERNGYLSESPTGKPSSAGFNWENVNKRLIPQILLKGALLQNEKRCHKGMFLVCSSQIAERIVEQAIAHKLSLTEPHPGSITILGYELGPPGSDNGLLPMNLASTTTLNLAELAILVNGKGSDEALVYEKAFYEKYHKLTGKSPRQG